MEWKNVVRPFGGANCTNRQLCGMPHKIVQLIVAGVGGWWRDQQASNNSYSAIAPSRSRLSRLARSADTAARGEDEEEEEPAASREKSATRASDLINKLLIQRLKYEIPPPVANYKVVLWIFSKLPSVAVASARVLVCVCVHVCVCVFS